MIAFIIQQLCYFYVVYLAQSKGNWVSVMKI
jgi:hypothetical protein